MTLTRRLPGIAFRAETPVAVDLPRMDVAAFVGFARRGPAHTPVAVESYPNFEDIFGGVYPLAWDDELAQWQTACLAPAVKQFFAQGGRRCWVVRVVSGRAAVNQFPVAGLLKTGVDGYSRVLAEAGSLGSWSDCFEVGADIQLDPLAFTPVAVQPEQPFSLDISLIRGQPVQAGDLLQLDFTDEVHRAYVVVTPGSVTASGQITHVTADPWRTYWFQLVDAKVHTQLTGTVQMGGVQEPVELDVTTMTLYTNLDPVPAETGDWFLLETAQGRVWLLAGEVEASLVDITQAWFEDSDAVATLSIARVQRVQMALQAREGPDYHRTLSSLAGAAPHPRFIGYLPHDLALVDPGFGQPVAPIANPAAALWEEVRQPRFPIKLAVDEDAVVIPLGLRSAAIWRGALPGNEDPLVRDGLVPDVASYEVLTGGNWSEFITEIFMDPGLRDTGQFSLINEANDRLYVLDEKLTGLHSLLPVEEVSMIALPDAAHRGLVLTRRETAVVPPAPQSPEIPDPCARDGPFMPCPAPEGGPADRGETPTGELPLEEEPTLWKLLPPLEFHDEGLLAIQTAAARLAAARSDLVAVLGLPKHYRVPDALRYQQKLNSELTFAGETTASYVALYHPWLVTREDTGDLLHTHPAGGACGVMAARTITLGAWVAPANEIVRGALATAPALSAEDSLALIGVSINPIIQSPAGITIWGAYTQSEDPELEDINVRRLLILMRRIALTEGQTYAFGPNSPDFRRRIQQQFEQRLSRMFARGAFAGREPSEAYRIVIDDTVNTPYSVEQGRLIVELRVAPSQPVTFITVRLVQLESGLLVAQEVTHAG